MKMIKTKTAFTLAEVLITLAIIGVIAAISVPSLIQKTNSAELKTAYKQAYAVASQAFDKAAFDGVLKSRTAWFGASNLDNFNAFKTYLKVVKDCNNNNNDQCWDPTGDKYYTNFPTQDAVAFIDNAGRAWSHYGNEGGNYGGSFFVDTNGFKKPNRLGKDRFIFQMVINGGASGTEGTPDSIGVMIDYPTAAPNSPCPQGECYYTSWLAGKD